MCERFLKRENLQRTKDTRRGHTTQYSIVHTRICVSPCLSVSLSLCVGWAGVRVRVRVRARACVCVSGFESAGP